MYAAQPSALAPSIHKITVRLALALLHVALSDAYNATHCSGLKFHDYEAPHLTLAIAFFVIGVLFIFFGLHLLKPTVFLGAAVVVSFFTFSSLQRYLVQTIDHRTWVLIGVSAGAGLISGSVALCAFDIGILLVGFGLGTVVGYLLVFVCGVWVPSLHKTIVAQWATVSIFGILGSVALITSKKLRNPLLALASAGIGAFAVVNSLDYVFCDAQLMKFMQSALFHKGFPDEHICWYTWCFVAAWVLLTLLGTWFQLRRKSDGGDNRQYLIFDERSHGGAVIIKRAKL